MADKILLWIVAAVVILAPSALAITGLDRSPGDCYFCGRPR